MRIMLMLSSIALSGAERNVVNVLPYMKKHGAEPVLCTLNHRRDSPLAQIFAETGLPRYDLGAKRLTDPAALKRLYNLIREHKIDLIHSQDQDANIYGALAKLRTGIPFIMTRHVLFEPTDTWKEKIRAQMVLLLARYFADRIVVVSKAVKPVFATQTGIPEVKIQPIYNGIDLEHFNTRAKCEAKRAEMGWPVDAPVVIFVGVLRRGKGHDVLLAALPQIKQAVPNVRIVLVGEGELEEQLRRDFAPHDGAIEFLGQRTDVSELLGASDVLVLPSWAEALPTVLIEAGAASLPVVATDVGGAAEIIVEGETGYLVEKGDVNAFAARLIEVIQDPKLARQMGEAGYDRVTNIFSLDNQAKNTLDFYQQVLGRS